MISYIIPTVKDPALEKTIDDIHKKSKLPHEIIPVYGKDIGMRSAINKGVSMAKGDYIAKVDDHCMFAKGFDCKLTDTIEDNWIVIPVRYALNPETWRVMEDDPIVYERLTVTPDKMGGVRWVTRTRNRKDVMLDEDMMFQGSFYLMSRKWWDTIGGLNPDRYGEFSGEAVELSLKTFMAGGKVMKNKRTWYAHKHRKFGRVYAPPGTREGNRKTLEYWTVKRKQDFNKYLEYWHGH